MKSSLLFLVAVGGVLACDRQPRPGPGDTGIALATTADAKDSLIRLKDSLLAERSRQLSEQSQLLGDAATSARLAAQIERSLADVRSLRDRADTVQAESALPTMASQLESVDRKVKQLIARLNASEARVRRMRSDSTAAAAMSSAQLARLAEYERSIGELRSLVEQQQRDLATLTTRVDSIGRENTVLVARYDTVSARNSALLAREDSAFVVIGTEEELLARGVARKEGGNRLLFGIGRTLVPARDLEPASFRVLSKARDLAIDLPRPDKSYQVVSRHSLQFTDQAAARDSRVKGTLTITNPARFWANSNYLILVER